MQHVLSLQMLGMLETGGGCSDSNVSCDSHASCRSGVSCNSNASTPA